MGYALEIGNQIMTGEELIPLLIQYQMLPQLLREMIIEGAIASITCTREETAAACQQLLKQHQINSAAEHEAWLKRYGINHPQFQALATRRFRIEKFQGVTWGHKLESYFLQRKKHLDQVIYSMIRTQDAGVIQELYFRILGGEQSFAELAHNYSTGPEAEKGGLVGPVELGTLHPGLAKQLQVSQPGQLWHPAPFGECFVIVRLEKFIPAQLDAFMRQRLLRELFEGWLQEQINQLPDADKAWMGTTRKQPQVKSANAPGAPPSGSIAA